MPKILQIFLGQVPEHLYHCIASVESYAKHNGFQYNVMTRIPEELLPPENLNKVELFQWRRQVSDIMRLEFLSFYQESLYIDWDVFLYDDFGIPDKNKMAFGGIEQHAKDSIIYNGKELEPFKEMLSRVSHPNSRRHNLIELINKYYNSSQRFSGHYVHFDNCRFRNL